MKVLRGGLPILVGSFLGAMMGSMYIALGWQALLYPGLFALGVLVGIAWAFYREEKERRATVSELYNRLYGEHPPVKK